MARCEGREVGSSALFFTSGEGLARTHGRAITFRLDSSVLFCFFCPRKTELRSSHFLREADGPLGEEPESVFNAGDLTWFLVCCCALSLLLGCRGVSLGMGPIGVGCRRRKQTEAVNISFQKKKDIYIYTHTQTQQQ